MNVRYVGTEFTEQRLECNVMLYSLLEVSKTWRSTHVAGGGRGIKHVAGSDNIHKKLVDIGVSLTARMDYSSLSSCWKLRVTHDTGKSHLLDLDICVLSACAS